MKKIYQKNKNLCVFFFIGITYLVSSTSFISWYHGLISIYDPEMVDLIAENAAYIMHFAGMIVYSVLIKRFKDTLLSPRSFTGLTVVWFVISFISVISEKAALMLILGLMGNLLLGVIFGYYLTSLSVSVTAKNRGIIFGTACATSCILTYLLSLPSYGTFLTGKMIWIIYACLTAVSIFFGNITITGMKEETIGAKDTRERFNPGPQSEAEGLYPDKASLSLITILGITIILINALQYMGFYFPSIDTVSQGISLEFSRAFYSIGLILAGLINDRSRKAGLIISSTTLIFPFISLLLQESLDGSFLLWLLAYIILGFYSVSRVILFSDYAAKSERLLFLAPFGLMFGRFGEALGVLLGSLLSSHKLIHIMVTAIFFAAALIMVFIIFGKLYSIYHIHRDAASSDPVAAFASEYSLSSREIDILKKLLDGATNKEISQEFFISENTVKFHIKNIYKKLNCQNRKELCNLYYSNEE